jgi:hypothetical protein
MTIMQPQPDNFAPYAPFKAVKAVIGRYRERGLPDPLSTAHLETIGVAGTMTNRTLQALRFLGLIDEGGNRLEAFERLRRAATDEYATLLAEVVRAAYLPVFTIVNPAEDTETAVADAFRRFEPAAQRDKMIALFRGLCLEAAIVARTTRPRAAPRPRVDAQPRQRQAPARREPQVEQPVDEGAGLPDLRLVSAVIQQLPRERHWSRERRERWVQALTSAIDLLFEVEEGE